MKIVRFFRFKLLSLTTTLADADSSIYPDWGEVPRGKNQRGPKSDRRKDRKPTVSATAKSFLLSVRDSVGGGRVRSMNSRLRLKPHIEVVDDGGDVNQPVGESDGMLTS